jgi:hypothetical protein
MGTGIYRAVPGLAALTLGLAACGSANPSAFGWLHPKSAPSDWPVAAVRSGARMAYPPNWRRQRSDRGTASAALLGTDGGYLGYLNVTPRQGSETLSNWASFRVEHNAEEGDRAVMRLAAATGLHFLTGHGSCVKDSYTTKVGAHYIEIACLVAGSKSSSVIVGAAPPGVWGRTSGVLERAISALRT